MNIFRRAITPPALRRSEVLQGQVVNTRSAMIGPATADRYAGLNGGQMMEWNAESAIRRQFMVNVVVYRCIQILAETIAALPFRAGMDPTKPEDFDLKAPLARLLGPPPGSPNPDLPPQALWAHTVAQFLVTGRFGWEIEWSGVPQSSQVVALWPLISQHIKPIATKGGEKAADGQPRYFKAFEYRADASKIRTLRSDQMYYDWNPALHDIHQAMSPLEAARLDTAVLVKQDIYDNAFLDNDARPAGILVTDEFENREDFEAYREELQGTYGGPANAGKTMIHEVAEGDGNNAQAVNWISLGLSQKDADFFQRYEQKVRGVCIALGVPVSKLDASGRTFDNADQEDETFELNTVIPLANRLQSSVNTRLAPLVGPEVGWFDLSKLKSQQQRKPYTDIDAIRLHTEAKATSLNELRAAAGEPPLPDALADKVEALELLKNPPPVPVLEPPVDPGGKDKAPKDDDPPALEKSAGPSPDQPERVSDKGSTPDVAIPILAPVVDYEARRARLWRSANAQISTLEKSWERHFRLLFAHQASAVASRLGDKRGRQALGRVADSEQPDDASSLVDTVFTYAYWQEQTEDQANELLWVVLAIALARLFSEFDYDAGIDASNPPQSMRNYIAQRSAFMSISVTNTTRDALQEQLAEGVAAGESAEQLADRTNKVFDDAADNRAPLIGLMEVLGAYVLMQTLAVEQYPAETIAGKEWVGQLDDKIRETHRRVNGDVIKRGDRFEVGKARMTGPHDPTAPPEELFGCRCILNWVSPEEMDERSSQAGTYRSVDEVTRELIAIATAA